MKGNFLFIWVILVSIVLTPAWAGQEAISPKISFEQTVCDLAQVGYEEHLRVQVHKHLPGLAENHERQEDAQRLLILAYFSSRCGCAVAKLEKKEYAPGESGTIKVIYTAPRTTSTAAKHIYVSSNDTSNPKVRLTIKAKVVQMVQADPAKLNLSLRKENLGLNEITIQSLDNQPFSIKSFASTNCNCLTADIDPNVSASKFVLHPRADIEKLKATPKGLVEIWLTHPQCRSIRIPYELLPEFKATPAQIYILSARPNQPITREITVASNYAESFEIGSISSKNGHIKLLNREKLENAFKLKLQVIPPPPAEGRSFFTDTLNIGIKGKNTLAVACRGFYPRTAVSRATKATNKALQRFKAEPQTVKVRNTNPGKPVIAVKGKRSGGFG